jgi:two-component system, NarL family, response regulator DevR
VRPTRVLVVESNDVVFAGLCSILDRDPGIHVVGAARTSQRGRELVQEIRPDVVVANQRLSDGSGIELCAWLGRREPSLPVLMLSLDVSDAILLRSLRAGARGFIYIGIASGDLRGAVLSLAAGDSVLDPQVAGRVIGLFGHRSLDRRRSLSRRETEVMTAVSGGASDRHIAVTLGLSHNTVKTYLRRSLDKLGCRTRSEAAAKFGRFAATVGPVATANGSER